MTDLKIPMHDVESSNVKQIGNSSEKSILRVAFKNGGVYDYADVTEKQYVALAGAESIGKHINNVIKPVHKVTKVN